MLRIWRKRVGIEPTSLDSRQGTLDLKSKGHTSTHSLPPFIFNHLEQVTIANFSSYIQIMPVFRMAFRLWSGDR